MTALLTPPTFRRVQRSKVYEEVAAQIQQQIAGGRLRPGDRLPPERELAETFGVSRASVRDAIRVLELAGLVVPRQGDGTVVRELTLDSVVSPLASVLIHRKDLLADLLDVRTIIEPPIAYRAALHARDEDVAAMEEILERQAARVAAGRIAIEEDTAFHYRLATAARNEIILKMLDVVMDLLREGRARSLQVRGRARRSLNGHIKILAAVRRGDPDGAAAAMREHLKEIAEVLNIERASGAAGRRVRPAGTGRPRRRSHGDVRG